MKKFKAAIFAVQAATALVAGGALAQDASDTFDQVPAAAPRPTKPRKPAPPVVKPAPKPHEHIVTPPLPVQPNPEGGETATQESTKFQTWTVVCNIMNAAPDSRHCVAKTEVLRSKGDPRPILFVGVIKDGDRQRFVLQTPTTTELKPGVKIDFGNGNEKLLEFASCEPALCTAEIQLDSALTEGLKTAARATVFWTAIGAGEVKVTFGLEGAREAVQFLATR